MPVVLPSLFKKQEKLTDEKTVWKGNPPNFLSLCLGWENRLLSQASSHLCSKQPLDPRGDLYFLQQAREHGAS